MTNYERIKEKSIDELATLLSGVCGCCIYNGVGECGNCKYGATKWLEAEAKVIHYIKLNEKYCDAVYSGEKRFEIRYNDKNYKIGDYVKFVPVRDGKPFEHPLVGKTYEITYVLNRAVGLAKDYVVFAIKESEAEND